jgi:hypothetical protein
VCYLRHRLWEKTRGKSKKFMKKHIATYRRLHDLTHKPSSSKGGGPDNVVVHASGGEFIVGDGRMHY